MRYNWLIFFLSGILLVSCYNPEPFPEKFVSEYELAIPLIDTVILASDFESIAGSVSGSSEIIKETPVKMGILVYSFSLGSGGDALQWIEPRIVLDTREFIQGTKIDLKIYLTDEDEIEKDYFWLPENYEIKTDNAMQIVETENNRIQAEIFRQVRRIWIDATCYFPENTPVSILQSKKIGVHLAVKCKTKSALNL